MRILDYIRIVAVSDVCVLSSNSFQVTYDIVHSQDSNFRNPKRGVFTLSLSDFVHTNGLKYQDIEKIASCLSGHVFMRGKEEDGTITILHLLGLPISYWFTKNAFVHRLNQ